MDGYGPSEDDCWSAYVLAARRKRNGLLFANFSLGGAIVWIVPMRFDRLS